MLKYAKIVNEETKQCDVGLGTNIAYYISEGMVEMEVEQAYDGQWYVKGYAPDKPAPTHEDIRYERQTRYTAEADPLRFDYDEALARGEPTAEEKKQAWLDKKDEIRAELPYPDEEE